MAGKQSIVKQSSTIRKELKKRLFDELGLSRSQIVAEANRFNQNNIKDGTLSRYLNGETSNSLTEESIIFLCARFGIITTLKIQAIPYDENSCIERVKLLFPETVK